MKKVILALVVAAQFAPAVFAKTKKNPPPSSSGVGPGEEAMVCVQVDEYTTGKIPGGLQYQHPFTVVRRNSDCPRVNIINLLVLDSDGTALTNPNQGNNNYVLGPPGWSYKDSSVPCNGCRTGMGPNGEGPAGDTFTITWPNGFHKLTLYACAEPAVPMGESHACVVPN